MPVVVTVTLNPAIDRTVSVPHFAAGEVNRAEQSTDKPGGKGVNVAMALALAGTAVAATGLLGSANRSLFADTFAHLGVGDRFVLLEGETRTGIKIVDPQSGQTTDINFPGLAPDAAALQRVLTTLLDAVRRSSAPLWIALSGSLPPAIDATLYADWISRLKAAGAHVLLDTSGLPLEHGIAAGPALVKPNRDELEALLGVKLAHTADIAAAARELIRKYGIRVVAVSMGADGACLVSAEAAVDVRPVKIPIFSTVGAGDAMVAGILHALCTPAAEASAPPPPREATTAAQAPDVTNTMAQAPQCEGLAHSDTSEAMLAHMGRCGTAFSLATLQQPPTLCAKTFRERLAHWLPQIKVDSIALQ